MSTHGLVVALPTEDRVAAHAFARALGLDTPGELADDGVPEPLRVVVNERASVMYVPTGGFGWVTAGRDVARRGTAECLLSLAVSSPAEVDDLVARAAAAGGAEVTAPQQQPWGYTGTFSDPDGHLWEVVADPGVIPV
ncbi:VOC family protein [Nocardioides sp.]|uniref:VOC family protein n=1 Tax=Nocardioides sp. TaxID=35761 RepID=UPI001A2FD0E2|nr:VOC family protein [Nocardioides sp.]MBJ7357720.1 VOC family protein [Nocardioides sp.]